MGRDGLPMDGETRLLVINTRDGTGGFCAGCFLGPVFGETHCPTKVPRAQGPANRIRHRDAYLGGAREPAQFCWLESSSNLRR